MRQIGVENMYDLITDWEGHNRQNTADNEGLPNVKSCLHIESTLIEL